VERLIHFISTKTIKLKNINYLATRPPAGTNKKEANKDLMKLHNQLFGLQNLFYAEGKHALRIILQGMDTPGKDSTIRHVFSVSSRRDASLNLLRPQPMKKKYTIFFGAFMPIFPKKE